MSDDKNGLRSPDEIAREMVRDVWSEPNDDGKTEWWTAIDGADVTVLLRLSDLSEYAHEAVDKMRRVIAGAIERDRAEGAADAHRRGIVEGLRRAARIVRAVESKQYDVEETFHVLREDIAEEIAKAERASPGYDPGPEGA